jgi:hypothetical protein
METTNINNYNNTYFSFLIITVVLLIQNTYYIENNGKHSFQHSPQFIKFVSSLL